MLRAPPFGQQRRVASRRAELGERVAHQRVARGDVGGDDAGQRLQHEEGGQQLAREGPPAA